MSKCQYCIFGTHYINDLYYCDIKKKVLSLSSCSVYQKKKKLKYNNKKTISNGIEFDSKKESSRYIELLMLQKNGDISDLERQIKFEIIPKTKTERASFYVADFVYYDKKTKTAVIEDVKSPITKKNQAYILKRKLVKYLYPQYDFREY